MISARVLEEICSWVGAQTEPPSKGQKEIRLFKPDDMCVRLNKKLDDAITHFSVCYSRPVGLHIGIDLGSTAEEPDIDTRRFE